MSDETITISTEEVKISELNRREKQIYDHAFERGIQEGYRQKISAKSFIPSAIIIILFFILILTKCDT